MSKMMKFHKLLSASSESQDPYLQALRAFTNINPARLGGGAPALFFWVALYSNPPKKKN